jgi:hypothetical protein
MSAAIVAISQLAAVKTSPIAQATLPLPHARALKFFHQKVGIKQEDDKTDLDQRSPDTFLHSNY